MTTNDYGWEAQVHSQREIANLTQTVILLEQRNEELQARIRCLNAVVRHQLPVISAAREAVRWWPLVCDRYSNLTAPWVGTLNLALSELDGDSALTAVLAARLAHESTEMERTP